MITEFLGKRFPMIQPPDPPYSLPLDPWSLWAVALVGWLLLWWVFLRKR